MSHLEACLAPTAIRMIPRQFNFVYHVCFGTHWANNEWSFSRCELKRSCSLTLSLQTISHTQLQEGVKDGFRQLIQPHCIFLVVIQRIGDRVGTAIPLHDRKHQLINAHLAVVIYVQKLC
mmetsp:Transcript_78910/g.152378  ORF Transcript_78910/g.152378 Transcript_78910/m.152378 type:complete len:120 (-) Transcript_78910:192-551(-)